MNVFRQGRESAQKFAFISITVGYGGAGPYVRASHDQNCSAISALMQLELSFSLDSKAGSYALFDKAGKKVNNGAIQYSMLDDLDRPLNGMKDAVLRHPKGQE
jgi:hypothetical protein